MKYFVKKTGINVGNIQYLQLQKDPIGLNENYKKAYFVEMLEGELKFNFYLYPWNGGTMLCLWFNHDHALNINHWDDELGLPKFIGLNEWEKYREIMRKPWPSYINAYERGRKKDFSAPALCKMFDVENKAGKKWCLCKLFDWNYQADDKLIEELSCMVTYLSQYFSELSNNDMSITDRIALNIKEGVKMGLTAYFQPLSIAKDFFSEVDWIKVLETDPNW